MKFCSKCGKQLSDEIMFCDACGARVESVDVTTNANIKANSVKKPNKKKLVIIAIALVALIVAGTVAGITISNNNAETEIEEYEDSLEETYELMITGAEKAEDYCSLKSKVWRNCIYENDDYETNKYTKDSYGWFYDDFNDALWAFEEGESLVYNAISDNKTEVDELIDDLKDYPDELEDEYKAIKELYVAYSEMVDLAIGDSTYSWNTFSEALENAKSDFKSAKSSAEVSIG